jgi:hypothetical protein
MIRRVQKHNSILLQQEARCKVNIKLNVKRKTFMEICITGMKRWKGMSEPG